MFFMFVNLHFFLLVAVYIMFAQLYILCFFIFLPQLQAWRLSATSPVKPRTSLCRKLKTRLSQSQSGQTLRWFRMILRLSCSRSTTATWNRTRPTAQTRCRCCQTGASSVCSCQKGSGWYLSTVLDFTILYCSIFDFIFLWYMILDILVCSAL